MQTGENENPKLRVAAYCRVFTGTMESEFMLCILSGLAAEKSVSISQNSKTDVFPSH
ncbi:hypothetical protein [Novisyntrophococcus fermenticellae]|uniref:hypothetical protein n=1 Tax=Novisyntrophococcus fermenticellae TaxID=2068655 RepID=UPI001E5455B7|nr:hypothetical protein [Novisyntrophococcus fermenticellae]